VTLTNTLLLLTRHGATWRFTGHEDQARRAIDYLDDAGFFELHLGKPLSRHAVLRDTTVPIQCVEHSQSHQWLQQNFVGWLSRRLHLTPASLADLNVCIKELFNNIQDHSGEAAGSLFVQHHPNDRKVIVCVADFGIGIPASMRHRFPGLDDREALLRSTRDGITSRSRPANRGAGLDLLIRNIVHINKGSILVHSGKATVEFFPNEDAEDAHAQSDQRPYPGTFFQLTLRTDTIEKVDEDRENLEW
jgi:anti-sigma regulatory factor (Ser/Thr protein kinase)